MKTIHTLALTLLMLCALLAGCAHSKQLTTLTREQATEDIVTLVNTITATHFKPHHTLPEADLHATADVFIKDLPEQISRKDFNLVLKQITAYFGDAATTIPSHPDFDRYVFAKNKPIIPLRFTYNTDDTFKVTKISPLLKSSIELGDTVIAINDIDVKDWLPSLREYVSGETDHLRNVFIAENFHILHWQLAGPAQSYLIKARNAAGYTYSLSVPSLPIPRSASPKPTNQIAPTPDNPSPYSPFPPPFHHNGQIALLKAPSFAPNLKPQFEETLRNLQIALQQYNTSIIILDLRGHRSGDPAFAYALLQQIAPFAFTSGKLDQRYTKIYEKNLIAYNNDKNKIPAILGLQHYFRLHWVGHPKAKSKYGNYLGSFRNIAPIPSTYKGDIIIITDHLTRGAGVNLAAVAKDANLALILGTPTASPASHFTLPAPAILPNSGLVLTAPTAFWTRPSAVVSPDPLTPHYTIDNISSMADETLIYQALQKLIKFKETY